MRFSWRDILKDYKLEKLERARQRYKTPKGLGYFELVQRASELCDSYGIAGPMRGGYLNFARKFSRELWSTLKPLAAFKPPEKFKEAVDKLLEYQECVFLEKYELDPEVVKALEKLCCEFAAEFYQVIKVKELKGAT